MCAIQHLVVDRSHPDRDEGVGVLRPNCDSKLIGVGTHALEDAPRRTRVEIERRDHEVFCADVTHSVGVRDGVGRGEQFVHRADVLHATALLLTKH